MKTYIYTLSVFVLLILDSCAIYAPTTINTPLFTEKGQVSLSGIVGLMGNFQGAYAITNHLAILANTSKYPIGGDKVKRAFLQPGGVGFFNEIGGGYFGKQKKEPI